MRFYEAISIAILFIVSFVFGVLARINYINPYPLIGVSILLFFFTYSFSWIHKYLETSGLRYISKRLLYMGRGIPRSFIRTQLVIIEISILAIVVTTAYMTLIAPRVGYNPLAVLALIGFIASLGMSLIIVRIRTAFTISFRKTSVEVELPFLLTLMRALAETHLTLYDLFNIIESSVALKAWAREVRLAKKLAATTNTSLLQALITISETHPSQVVRDVFRRIVTVGHLAGSVREVVGRAFQYIFDKLQQRLMRLVEKLDIVNGVIMFGFMFMPIILATIAPIMGQSPVGVFFMSAIIEAPTILIMYAFLTHMYPSGFAISTPKTLVLIASISMMLITFFIGVYLHPVIQGIMAPCYTVGTRLEPGMSEYLLYTLVGLALIPPTIYSELWYRKVVSYTKLMRAATDAAEVSASLGANFVSVFERTAAKYGERVHRLARSIIEGYKSEVFRKAVVLRAPSIFHATFVETLLYTLLVGVSPQVLKTLTKSYEVLMNLMERTIRISRTLEGMVLSLSAMMGFFIRYLEKMFTGFYEMIASAMKAGEGGMGFSAMFGFFKLDVNVYYIISTITLLSIIFVSLFTGKTRGGSLVYGFRTALISFILYASTRIIVDLFVVAPIPTQ